MSNSLWLHGLLACQDPLSIEFRQEYWNGLPFPSPEDLHKPGIEPRSPALRADSLPSEQSVQFSSVTQLCPTLCDPMNRSKPGLHVHHNSQRLPKLMSIESLMPSNHLILCHPFLLLPSIFPSIRVFSSESALHTRWPKYWSFSFNINPSKEHRELISFRMDWLDLLAVQGTLQESSPIPQFKSINSSALSFLYSPTLTSIYDYCKNHSLVWAIKKDLNGMFSSLTNIKLQDLLGNYKINLV